MASTGDMFEIMSWLPAKPLYRLSTIAKEYKEFLSENYFVEKQCRNSCAKSDESLIIQDDSCLRTNASNLQFSFLPENQPCGGIPKRSLTFLSEKGRVLASSNGLLLCRNNESGRTVELFLCNPATRYWLPIKLPNEELSLQTDSDLNIALVCGNASGKKFPSDISLLIFAIHDANDWESGYDVYGLEEGSWVLKEQNMRTGRDLNFDEQACCKNSLYFLSDYGCCYSLQPWPFLFQYDVENGNSRTIAVPRDHEGHKFDPNVACFRLFGWDRKKGNSWFESICLTIYYDNILTIWVLEEIVAEDNNTSTSWRCLRSITVESLGINEACQWTNSFIILDKNLIFADAEGLIYRYNILGEDHGKPDMICAYENSCSRRLRFNSYSSTLRPCYKYLNKPSLRIN